MNKHGMWKGLFPLVSMSQIYRFMQKVSIGPGWEQGIWLINAFLDRLAELGLLVSSHLFKHKFTRLSFFILPAMRCIFDRV